MPTFNSLTMPPVPNGAPSPGEIYQHKNGNVYRVMFITNLGNVREDHPPQVVYAGENDNIWSRPLTDWSRSMSLLASGF